MIQVEWEKSALNRHEAWALNIALEFTSKHALSYLHDIENGISTIVHNPYAGQPLQTLERPNLRRLVSGGGYSIFYYLNSEDRPERAIILSILRGQP